MACCQIPEKRLWRGVKKCAAVTTRSIYAISTGFDGNGSIDSLPLYGNEAIVESRAAALIAFPDSRNARMPLTPSLHHAK